MTPSETAELLAYCAAFDSRTVGEADVYAWQSVLETVDLDTAKEAVRAWYAQHRERIMPADVNTHAKAVRDARFALEQRQRAFDGRRLALAPAPGRVGQRVIGEPSPWYVQAKETLAQLRNRPEASGE